MLHSVCSRGYGICSEEEPSCEMEKVLFAAALMRPSKSVSDMEMSSVKKKFKDKRFAGHEVMREGDAGGDGSH